MLPQPPSSTHALSGTIYISWDSLGDDSIPFPPGDSLWFAVCTYIRWPTSPLPGRQSAPARRDSRSYYLQDAHFDVCCLPLLWFDSPATEFSYPLISFWFRSSVVRSQFCTLHRGKTLKHGRYSMLHLSFKQDSSWSRKFHPVLKFWARFSHVSFAFQQISKEFHACFTGVFTSSKRSPKVWNKSHRI